MSITPAPPEYEEVVDDRGGIASAGFSIQVQKANAKYFVDPERIEDAITDILGDVEPNGFGGLKRRLPACHPRYSWLYANNIGDIREVGLFENQPSAAAWASVGPDPMTSEYAQNEKAILSVEFTPRPYCLIPDHALYTSQLAQTITWHDTDTSRTSTIGQEHRRFIWIDYLPRTQIITAQQGQMTFRVAAPYGGGPVPPPNKVAFGGKPQMRLPGGQVKIHWFQVPYSWVIHAKSWISYLQGRINQTRIFNFNDEDGWAPGELLYESCDVTSYIPPAPDIDTSLGDGVYSAERLCDITFNMIEATRPQELSKLPIPTNKNWIAGGHNLMPWVKDRQFYYVTSSGANPGSSDPDADDTANPAGWTPTFFSADFRLLFSDPNIASSPPI